MIYLDFDGVIADLHPEWFRRFNEMHGLEIDYREATDWHLSGLIPEDFKPSFYRILNDPELYELVEPIPGALETIVWLNANGLDWRIATSCSSEAMVMAKVSWLIRYGIADRCRGGWPINLIPIRDKHLLHGDMLLDDGPHNLEGFRGLKLLFVQPHNRTEDRFARIKSWRQFREFLQAFYNTETRVA